jgi:atypical dual specificity phosphatase
VWPHPFDWLIPEQLGVCVNPMVVERAALELEGAGIRLLVNLHERPDSPELLARLGAESVHLPVPDTTAPTQDQLDQGVAAIRQALGRGERVAVHCGAGLGRSGTLLAAFLVDQGSPAEQAMARVRAARPGAIETADQEEAIHEFERRRRAAG